jgi:ABC-2 type transport system permease protein
MTTIILPIFFLSSALFPSENLSGGLAIAVMLNPFTHIINALRSLIFGETILIGDILPVIILFIMMCCGSFSLAIWRLKKETTC